jgi:hypothetical protein
VIELTKINFSGTWEPLHLVQRWVVLHKVGGGFVKGENFSCSKKLQINEWSDMISIVKQFVLSVVQLEYLEDISSDIDEPLIRSDINSHIFHSWKLDLLDVVVSEQMSVLGWHSWTSSVLVSKTKCIWVLWEVVISAMSLFWPGWVSVKILVVEINDHSFFVIADDIESVVSETHICDWGIDHIRDRVDQVELILSPEDDCDITIAACEENISIWVSFKGVNAMESSIFSVSGVVDHLSFFVKGHGA